ncbi:hypothetical protein GCM10009555_040790 [Acrocarpospora macrocephala]|uniref:Uncharacterized protein n=1 Tax=Acrocarpospora macrocephala TaxID=150177 RepID=A0A5M3WP58_9ACTN|nr:hypothetical protein Amac_035450 [Acrocarpospora macrocephala]
MVGKRLIQVRRAFYEFEGTVERDEGLIELSFSDGVSVRFDVGADGESLATREGPWVDPFAPPHSIENEEYIRTHGKYSAFDVSVEDPYREMIGREVSGVHSVIEQMGHKCSGIVIEFGDLRLLIEVVADGLYVSYSGA